MATHLNTSTRSSTAVDPWVSTPGHSPQARLRLFCFPFAGGGTAAYYPWAKRLAPEIALCSIRLPGRESRLRETPHVRITPLVEDLADALAPFCDRPFAFFGHSMGALIAFELARHLRREKMAQPLHLFASGHRAPQLPDPETPLYRLPDDAFVREINRRYNGIPEPILQNPELLKLFLPLMRADATILDTYQYTDEPKLAFPISVFGGTDDPSVNRVELDGWKLQTQGPCRLTLFAGDHFFIQSAQTQVVQSLNDELAPYLQPTRQQV